MAFKRNPKLLDQLQYCEKNQVELCVVIGSSELEAGTVKIRDIITREEVRFFYFSYNQYSEIFSSKFHESN
jgi:histidyl-tRNA synthetase